MPTPYPLKPVVCSQPELARSYDADVASIDLISACLTPAQLASLIDEGAVFEAVIFLNGEGEALRERLCPEAGDHACHPRLTQLRIEPMDNDAVQIIHAAFDQHRAAGFFVAGG